MPSGSIKKESVVKCPKCGFESAERMPEDRCIVRYSCKRCGFIMTPRDGDCCIFCSYGTVPCPPVQEARLGAPP